MKHGNSMYLGGRDLRTKEMNGNASTDFREDI